MRSSAQLVVALQQPTKKLDGLKLKLNLHMIGRPGRVAATAVRRYNAKLPSAALHPHALAP